MPGFCKTYPLATENHTKLLAESLAKIAKKGDIFLLKGDLGAGKTMFVRCFIRFFLGERQEVPSPTFTMVQMYPTKDFMIWHLDLYRLKSPNELDEIGIEDAFYRGVSLVEWPERLENYKPKKFLFLLFENENNGRKVTVTSSEDWEKRLNDF
ncbi:MAG: tRNA (adenosine(37)-N6)-threonylcarbamoyltransferase complex ATPase subunit type 1 TsaE [Alphaproteobacteria bacterium RIFCSPHIGHO2_01_FULL_41_14]|nr:MAG: tRNA (adenosine(37)-N6)-threonylcarbamoyltransferase complex ATPase subunit type 1 TsaE [Alphaproteobacteria bacterium GWB1_45_5]OFW76275.1 MAG: tRNA (adenosine(37)-N6)-threonylcarbamoyltransferase complex ATPase subunit type 1 TsaE [Alphaproteobacteria bacterium GWA1_45_9]OFW89453.1 MAG: tRNA (adenosine(37)-N6)-threonylcarbamoyltransferase complex ATPase subunit type 1 TsaE [Alphaproteobacteria bacterium RIFCSPHIGHO2_01_FULL_41_14]HCI48648.1 tRNA (adenosine(37)-N6)-threonylcarbamoyltran